MREAVLVELGMFMKSHGAISGALLRREPAQDGVRLFAAWAEVHIDDDASIFIDETLTAEDDLDKAISGFYLCDPP